MKAARATDHNDVGGNTMQTWNKIAAWLLAAALLTGTGIFPVPAKEGTSDGWVSVSTPEELDAIRKDPAGRYRLTADVLFTPADFAEGGAFYHGGQLWQPIGSKEAPFTGVLDGNGHTVKGLRINAELDVPAPDLMNGGERPENFDVAALFEARELTVGLFGYSQGTLRDLKLEDLEVKATVSSDFRSAKAFLYAGGLAGVCEEGAVTGCSSSGSVTALIRHTASNGSSATGGVTAGGLLGSILNAEVSDCSSSCSVSAETDSHHAIATVGGIAGTGRGSVIASCSQSGRITAKTVGFSAFSLAGGIAGSFQLNYDGKHRPDAVSRCRNSGAVTVSATSTEQDGYDGATALVGGIVGDNECMITHCENVGAVTADAAILQYKLWVNAGGIVGRNNEYLLTGCRNAGKVTATSKGGTGESQLSVGGIAGCADSSGVSYCANTGAVSVTADSGKIAVTAGGLIGDNRHGTAYRLSDYCSNLGDLTVVADNESTVYAGGLMGRDNNSGIHKSYNGGDLKINVVNRPSIVALDHSNVFAGGIAGEYERNLNYCYSVGKVTASAAYVTLGGLSGNGGGYAFCFCPDDLGRDVGNRPPNPPVLRSRAAMQKKETFEYYDFEGLWKMGDKAYPYPVLRYAEGTGEADGDGKITSTDARLALQLAVEKVPLDKVRLLGLADVDHDGKVTSTDARLILQYSVGKIKEWP